MVKSRENTYNLDAWIKNTRPKIHKEKSDLEYALEISKREHIEEQKRLFSLLSSQRHEEYQPTTSRYLQVSDDEDDFFQTVSNRVQPKKPVKKEKNDVLLDISDMSDWIDRKGKKKAVKEEKSDVVFNVEDMGEWMNKDSGEQQAENNNKRNVLRKRGTKKSTPIKKNTPMKKKTPTKKMTSTKTKKNIPVEMKQEDVLMEIPDINAWIDGDTYPATEDRAGDDWLIPKEEESAYIDIPDMNEWIGNNEDEDVTLVNTHKADSLINQPVFHEFISRDKTDDYQSVSGDSDCSVIDLCDEDGYLSPLEGFTTIADQPRVDNPYFEQLRHHSPSTAKPSPKKKKEGSKKSSSRGKFPGRWKRRKSRKT
ncbi:hypothetical protein BDB01DRAFT_853628 [Pilobolus umbonatus]|nr:hypothetical protein BDB01DRAFT_853628 [Pilobolus umbonatus]